MSAKPFIQGSIQGPIQGHLLRLLMRLLMLLLKNNRADSFLPFTCPYKDALEDTLLYQCHSLMKT